MEYSVLNNIIKLMDNILDYWGCDPAYYLSDPVVKKDAETDVALLQHLHAIRCLLEENISKYGRPAKRYCGGDANNAEWISVKDRLPVAGSYALVCGPRGGMSVAQIRGDLRDPKYIWWKLKGTKKFVSVTHWMPLPEPAKEGGGEDGN